VKDNGSGIPLNSKKGVGLLSMQERASELGGYFSVQPLYTGGTKIESYLPY
jgi:signal transduction histidine kinase